MRMSQGRPQYEYRRILRWPNGLQSVTLGTGELQAREDCALAQLLEWTGAQGVTITLERRRVGAWAAVEAYPLPPPSAGDIGAPVVHSEGSG